MKIRNGFVSNSSSSSFIISSDAKKVPTIKIEVQVDRIDGAKCIETEDELKEYFIERYYLKYSMKNGSTFVEAIEIEGIESEYKKSINAINSGKSVWIFEACSDGDDDLGRFLYYHGLPQSDSYEIIYSCEG